MTNPVVDLVGDRTGRFFPVYPQSERANLSTWELAKFVEQALDRCAPRGIADPVPAAVLRRFEFTDRHTALNWIHRPTTMSESVRARKRLVFDELLRMQLELVRRKRRLDQHTAASPTLPAENWSTTSCAACRSRSRPPSSAPSTR